MSLIISLIITHYIEFFEIHTKTIKFDIKLYSLHYNFLEKLTISNILNKKKST